jgi:DNA invertase Pin-like site-specific DNA recombinase
MTDSAIIYARASAECRASIGEQVECLQGVADSQGWSVIRTFTDRPRPPKRGREQRPAEAALLNAIRAGKVSRVLLFGLDRIGRTSGELIGFLEACRVASVDIYIHDRGIDTASCNGLSLFDLGTMVADHLRQARRDRILRGQAAARDANVRFGRPPILPTKVEKARREIAAGRGVREAARLAGISPASASRIKAAMGPMSPVHTMLG